LVDEATAVSSRPNEVDLGKTIEAGEVALRLPHRRAVTES
jgi:hypothetical protein